MAIITWPISGDRCGRGERRPTGPRCRRTRFPDRSWQSIMSPESRLQTEITASLFIQLTELNRTNYPELRDRVLASEAEPATIECRSYPGFPCWPLGRLHARCWPSLDRALSR